MDAPLVDLLSGHGHRRVAMCGSDKPLKASKREARSKINIPIAAFWKTTRSIGGRCKRGNTFSRAVLIRLLASAYMACTTGRSGSQSEEATSNTATNRSFPYPQLSLRRRSPSPRLRRLKPMTLTFVDRLTF